MRKLVLCSLAVFGGLVVAAEAGNPKKQARPPLPFSGNAVHPLRYAKVQVDARSVTTQVIGPWLELSGNQRDGACSSGKAFDALDADWPDGGDPVLDPAGNRCARPVSSRYWFGATYNNPNSVDDLTVDPASNGHHL